MIFNNYSQTYMAQITAAVGLFLPVVNLLLPKIGLPQLGSDEAVAIIGTVMNFAGIVWTLVHRHSKGDVTALGARKC